MGHRKDILEGICLAEVDSDNPGFADDDRSDFDQVEADGGALSVGQFGSIQTEPAQGFHQCIG